MRIEKIIIQNKLGLHARASMKLINVAGRFQSDIFIQHDKIKTDAKDILNVMSLAANKGTEIEIITEGPDEDQAMDAIIALIKDRFGEEE